jgi:hypothetical protein
MPTVKSHCVCPALLFGRVPFGRVSTNVHVCQHETKFHVNSASLAVENFRFMFCPPDRLVSVRCVVPPTLHTQLYLHSTLRMFCFMFNPPAPGESAFDFRAALPVHVLHKINEVKEVYMNSVSLAVENFRFMFCPPDRLVSVSGWTCVCPVF